MNRKGWIQMVVLLSISSALFTYAADLPDLARIKISAEGGDALAQYQLAERYGMRMDSAQAEAWLRKSAAQGFAPAQGKLGSRLLLRYRTAFGVSIETKAAIGQEAITWLSAGAIQGDVLAQGDLASAIMEGKLVKQDLLAAYKWGSLAAQGPPLNTGTFTGKSARDAAILKMNADQIKDAEKLVEEFKPQKVDPPKKPLPSGLKLQGVGGTGTNRLALINGKNLAAKETADIKIGSQTLKLTCVEIRESSAVIRVEGIEGERELKMK